MYNVGIIGYGGMGKLHAGNLGRVKDARLAAVCDPLFRPRSGEEYSVFGPSAAPTAGFKVFKSAGEMFGREKIDVVINATPSFLHTEINLEALRNGCHVFTEKPFSLNSRECEQVIKASRVARRILMVGQCMRFWPGWRELREFIKDGRYGKLLFISLRRLGGTPSHTGWFADPKKSGGVLMDLHIHDVDFLNFLLGMPRRLRAQNRVHREKGIDVVTADFVFEDTLAGVESGWIGKYGFVMEYKAVFEERIVRFLDGRFQIFDTNRGEFVDEAVAPDGGHALELDYFFDCVRTNTRPVLCQPEASRDAIRLLELERKSIATGKELRVPAAGASGRGAER